MSSVWRSTALSRELQRVGVLELVDERRAVAHADGRGDAVVGHRVGEQAQQVLVGEQALLVLVLLQRTAHVLDQGLAEALADGMTAFQNRLQLFPEGMLRLGTVLLAAVAGLEAGRRQHADAPHVGRMTLEPALQLLQEGLDVLETVLGRLAEAVGTAQVLADDLGFFLPQLLQHLLGGLLPLQRSGIAAAVQDEVGLAQQRTHVAGNGLEADAVLLQQVGEEGVVAVADPGLLHEDRQQLTLVRHDVGLDQQRRHLRFGQHALAETVDGEDARLVEAAARFRETLACGLTCLGSEPCQDPFAEIVFAVASRKRVFDLHDALAQAVAQLGGGGAREGHDEDLRDVALALQQQAQVE
ncbi:MAG: hypothetical protein K0R03_1874, partial [Moraxellaceae bacterium]|nr:hypothetical protein [Moraxellaceae bacterium]